LQLISSFLKCGCDVANEGGRYTAYAERGKNTGEIDIWCCAEQ